MKAKKPFKTGGGWVFPLLITAVLLSATSLAKTVTLEVSSSAYSGGEVENFQALVKLSEGDAYGFSYADCAATDGSDIYFTTADGETVLASETDTWNAYGDSYIWVKMPSMTPKTKIQMHWGDAEAAATAKALFTPSDVWTGCVGVWHMNGTGTASEPDKTANGLNATPLTSSSAATSLNTATGTVGAGRAIPSDGKYFSVGSSSNPYHSTLTTKANFSVSGWCKLSSIPDGNGYQRIFCGMSSSSLHSWDVWREHATQIGVRSGNGSGNNSSTAYKVAIAEGETAAHYLTIVWEGTSAKVYENGALVASQTLRANTHPNSVFTIGGRVGTSTRSFVGVFDEVRMYDGAVSADRAKADYKTMSAPTEFLVLPTPVWNNTAGDGALDNPANWSSGSVPESGGEATLMLSGDTTLTTATALAFGALTVDGAGSAVFPANVTATGLALMADVAATLPGTAGLANGGLSGAGTLVLDPGAGATMTMTTDNTAFSGEVVVKSGTVKFGNRHSFGFGGLPNSNINLTTAGTAKVRVKGGATLDVVNGSMQNWTGWPCTSTVLEEGAFLVSSSAYGDHDGVALATPLKLDGDATLSNTGKGFSFGTRSYGSHSYAIVDVGRHTLSLEGGAATYMTVCATRGDGTIDAKAGTLVLRGGGGLNINGARPQIFLTNGLVKVRSGVKLQVSKENQDTAATIKNLQLDGAGTVDASQSLTVTGFLTGGGSINRVTLANGAAFKPDGSNYFTITDTLTGTLTLDATEAAANAGSRIPLVRIPTAKAESLEIENIPSAWQLKQTADGDNYTAFYLQHRKGLMIIIR